VTITATLQLSYRIVIDFTPKEFKNRKQKKFYITYLEDEIDNINHVLKTEKKTIKGTKKEKIFKNFKRRCQQTLKELQP